MSFQKFQATHLFTGTELLGPDQVLITDEKGKIEAIVPENEAGPDIQQLTGILSPGLINCHCHLELSHMKGLIPEKTGLVDFVFKVVNERHFPEEEILSAIDQAEIDMIQNGIVAVGDICNNILTIPQKQKQRLSYYNFVEVSGWLPNVAQIRFDRSFEFFQAFEQLKIQNSKFKTSLQLQTPDSKLKTGLSPHAPYSVSNELWNLISPYFNGNTVTIHNQETNFEDLLFQKGEGDFTRMYQMMQMDSSFFHPTGKSSLQSYFSKMANAKRVLLVHDTFTSEEDVLFVNRESSIVSWCVCINANQYIEQAVPPIEMLRKNNAEIVIGTDSLASNWSLSILDEMKTIQKFFPHIELKEILQWATKNGATALQMEDRLGTFEKGKQPGIVLFENINETHFQSSTTVRILV